MPQDFPRLAKALDRDVQWLARRVTSSLDREFVYLVRHMRPQDAAKVAIVGGAGVDPLILMPSPMPGAPPLKVALVRMPLSKPIRGTAF